MRPTLKLIGTQERHRCEQEPSRCGHEWRPRFVQKPEICPKCKSPYWDREISRPTVSAAKRPAPRPPKTTLFPLMHGSGGAPSAPLKLVKLPLPPGMGVLVSAILYGSLRMFVSETEMP